MAAAAVIALVGCGEYNKAPLPAKKPNVEVKAPGVKVKVDDKETEVAAPGAEVKTP